MKRPWKLFILILLCILASSAVIGIIFRSMASEHTSGYEQFNEQLTVYIIPQTATNASISYKSNDIVFNQGTPLKLQNEFLIANPELTVDQIKTIASEILPESSLHNFVVMK
jgi:hypothetical protein